MAATFGNGRSSSPYSRREVRSFGEVLEELSRFAAVATSSSASSVGEAASSARAERVGCYAANLPLDAALPELAAHWRPIREMIGRISAGRGCLGGPIPGSPALYLGAGLQRTPLHFDPTENLTVVLQGTKVFRLFPPSASASLQPRGGLLPAFICWARGIVPAVYSGLDAWEMHAAPNASSAPSPLEVHVHAGEVIYLPATWWHAVAGSVHPNVTLVFGYEPVGGA